MDLNRKLKLLSLIFICSLALLSGCSGSGGGSDGNSDITSSGDDSNNHDDDNTGTTVDLFSPASYDEATSANQSLSGIWLMLEEHESTLNDTYTDHETGQSVTEIYRSNSKRRELFVITDTDSSPTGVPRISGCDRPQNLVINGNAISFLDDGATYSATFGSNTHITGSSMYESYRDASDDSPNQVQSGTFTLIKLASLPENFEVDASSDAYGDSYTKALNSIGTVTARAQPAHSEESFERSGEVRCFVHTEGTYTDTENATQIDKGRFTEFWAGSSGGPEVEIDRNEPDGSLAYLQIDIYEPPYFHIDLDNSIFDEITGVSTLSIDGTGTITVKGSVSGADEGDAGTSINITLP